MGNYYQVDFCAQENEIDCNEGHSVYVHKNHNGPITGFFRAFSSQWGIIFAPTITPTENMISVNATYCMYLVTEPNTVDNNYVKDTYTDFLVDCELKRKYNISHESYMERIVDKLLCIQNKEMAGCEYGVYRDLNSNVVHEIHNCVSFNPLQCQLQVDHAVITHPNKVSADFNDINKTKGFLNHDETTFEFIGPDRELSS